jgi:hypothetical protein
VLDEAIAEDWTTASRGQGSPGTEVRGQLRATPGLGHFAAIGTTLHDEQEREAFRAALGTIAPTPWISPSTYEVALEHFVPLRRDPEFVDPDILVVISAGHRQLVEIKWRTWAYESVRQLTEAVELVIEVPRITHRRKRRWIKFDELVEASVFGPLASPAEAVADLSGPQQHEAIGAGLVEWDEPLPESALVAQDVRNLSGLSAKQLGEIFPVARENFQRWTTGTPPSDANLQRLLGLRHLFRALADRVDDPKVWLFSPLDADVNALTPYSLLQRGRVTAVWDAVAGLSRRVAAEEFTDSEGGRGLRIRGSVRGREGSTAEGEMDDYSEWLDEE